MLRPQTAVVTGLVLALSLTVTPSRAAAPRHDKIPSPVPSTISPAVIDGQVNAIVQVGTTMVIGGTFTKLTPKGGALTNRVRAASFDASTGALRAFNPAPNNEVMDVLEGPTPGTVYVAGSFTSINGASASHLALLDAASGARVPGFTPPSTNGAVNTITRAGNRLLLGGNFTVAGGQTHQGLASINPSTGAIDHAFMGIDVSERHNNSGDGAVGSVGVKDMEATPDGSKLVAIGNFRTADGLSRVQILVANLSGATAAVDPSWNTRRYEPLCYVWAFDSDMRGVSVSPDGRFFVVSATGGGTRNTLCDTAARFEFSSAGADIAPTWVDSTGGDTLWSAEITEQAVYVGGHQRWQNNVDGVDYANQGAVPRPGLAALDLESGVPIAWNPGRLPRGLAVFVLYATPAGLWLGSDTDYIGNYKYKRPKLAFFPLAGGAPQASDQVAALPGKVYLGGRTIVPNTLSTIAYDGTTATGPTNVDARGIAWDSVRGAFLLGDKLFYGKTDGYLYKRTFTGSTTGAETRIDPYNDPAWADANDGVGGTERGEVPTFYGQISGLTGLFYAGDRIYFTRSGDTHLYWRWFNADSGIVGSQTFTADGGRSWIDTGGLFKDGSTLYIVSRTTGALQKVQFANGAPSGVPVVADGGRDWRAKTVFIGPAAVVPPGNVAPTASFTISCALRTCSVDGSGSHDSDGSIASYAWGFGDGGTDSGARPTAHTYNTDGSHTITLTVTDNGGASAVATRTVVVSSTPPTSGISQVGQSLASAQTNMPRVTIPANVQAGDQLVLIGTYGLGSLKPTPPAGWTLAASNLPGGFESYVWERRAVAGEGGTAVVTQLSASAKSTLTLSAYRGVAAIADIAGSADASTAQHTTPTVTAPDGGWVLQAWSDKSSTTTSWTPPIGVTARGTSIGSGSGRTSALLADSGGPVSAGTYGGATAVTDAPSTKGIAWALALATS